MWYSSSDLAGLPGMPAARENVTRKALAEGWQFRQRNGRGGGREYAYASLPARTQAALHRSAHNLEKGSLDLNPGATDGAAWIRKERHERPALPIQIASTVASEAITVEVTGHQPPRTSRQAPKIKATGGFVEQRTDAWLEILRAYETWCEVQNCNNAVVRDIEFTRVYNNKQLRLPDWVYDYVRKISRSTLKAKNRCRHTANQLKALGGNYGNRKGRGKIDSFPDLQQAIETCIAAGGKHWGPAQIYEILLLEFGYEPKDCSLGQLRSWIRKFRQENPQKWSMYINPDRANGTAVPAFGSRAQGVVRPNQVWELDSLRVDLVLKYQSPLAEIPTVKRYSMVGCIDLFTRRAILLLSDTSKAEAICLLLAAAILKWGVPEGIRTDHGKEYLSRQVKRFLANLNIRTDDLRCLPGHPEQKPFIERFNRTFQHRDLPKLPGFLGHSVADRQALRANQNWNEAAIELAMSPETFQAWCDAWCIQYEQRPHGRPGIGLEGRSPLTVLEAAIAEGWQNQQIRNPRELDFLMMAAPTKDGMRRVGRQGISLNGRLYIAGELGAWIGKRVYVCFSPNNPKRIYVYKSADLTQYICEAVWREAEEIDLAQIARQATVAYQLVRQEVNQTRKRGRALLRKIAKEPMSVLGQVQEVLPLVQSQLHDYPALQAIAQAIATTEPSAIQLQISPEQYQAELAQLEIQEAEQQAQRHKAIALNTHLETFLELWQRGGNVTNISSEILSEVVCYLETSQGKGYLGAVTDSLQEEHRFRSWLVGEEVEHPVAVDPNQLLRAVFEQWSKGLTVPASEREFVAHYIQLPAGKGTLNALAEEREEQQRFWIWLSEPDPATV